jgi:hypothetical protein
VGVLEGQYHSYIRGEVEEIIIDNSIAFGIQDTEEANEFIQGSHQRPM